MLHNEARKLLIEAWNKTHNAKEIAECFSVNISTGASPMSRPNGRAGENIYRRTVQIIWYFLMKAVQIRI